MSETVEPRLEPETPAIPVASTEEHQYDNEESRANGASQDVEVEAGPPQTDSAEPDGAERDEDEFHEAEEQVKLESEEDHVELESADDYGDGAVVEEASHAISATSTAATAINGEAEAVAVAVAPPPPLPQRRSDKEEGPELPPRRRAPFFWLKRDRSESSVSDAQSQDSAGRRNGSVVNTPDYHLVLSRLDANTEILSRDGDAQGASLNGVRQIQMDFEAVRQESSGQSSGQSIDWAFWSAVVANYGEFASKHPAELSRAIAQGFPGELRGLIWQLITSSKSASMEELYRSILAGQSTHEKSIRRDLSRTSFIKNANADQLFNIIKAYSIFDPEVGYTQGMAFITVPLLINMDEADAFCLLVHLMKDYGFRQMYLADMPGLHLRLYQFDRLIEDQLPEVHIHLTRQGVRSSMYASQWFLTLFAYKFPLQLVLRIFDMVIAEGVESILRFGLVLMKQNAARILTLEFDQVLPFLKDQLFDYYLLEDGVAAAAAEPQYSVHDLVSDAYNVRILPITLRKYEDEYKEITRIERERVEEVETLRGTNGHLQHQVRKLEGSLADLNAEHIHVANEMVQNKLEVARLQDENENLRGELEELKKLTSDQADLADATLREQMTALEAENEKLKARNAELESQVPVVEQELVETKMKMATLDDSHSKLRSHYDEMKKYFEGFKD